MRTRFPLAALLLAALPLAGCDGADDGSKPGPVTLLALPSEWRLVSSDSGVGPRTLRLAEGGFSAHVFCNAHFGTATFSGVDRGAIRFDVQGSTRASCGVEGNAYEGRFVRTFDAVRSYTLDGDVLTLRGPGVRLRFERVEDAAP